MLPKGFKRLKSLSSNRAVETVLALRVNGRKGEQVVVKFPGSDFAHDYTPMSDVLQRSFSLQRSLRSSSIVAASDLIKKNKIPYTIYPFLAPGQWETLSPKILLASPREILIQIGRATDLIHSLQLVHLDLKLSNFVIRKSTTGVNVKLIDLDFLCEEGYNLGEIILGTPEFIDPALKYAEVARQSADLYSIGKSIEYALRSVEGSREDIVADYEHELAWVKKLSERLSAHHPDDRPVSFLRCLSEVGAIDEMELERQEKRIFTDLIVSVLSTATRESLPDTAAMQRLVAERARVSGISPEVFEEMLAFGRSHGPRESLRFLLGVIRGCEIHRLGQYFLVNIPDQLLGRVFARTELEPFKRLTHDSTTCTELSADRALQYCSDLEAKKYFVASFLLVSLYLRISAKKGPRLPENREIELLRYAINAAKRANRVRDSIEFCERILEFKDLPDITKFEANHDLVYAHINSGHWEEAIAIVDGMSRDTEDTEARGTYYRSLCLRAWAVASLGNTRQAAHDLEEVLSIAREQGFDACRIDGHYIKAAWEQFEGRFEVALSNLDEALELAERFDKKEQTIVHLSLKTRLLYQMMRLDEAVDLAKKTYRLSVECGRSWQAAFSCCTIVYACVRLGEFKKAHYWSQRLGELVQSDRSDLQVLNFQHVVGYLLLYENRIEEARTRFSNLLSFTDREHGAQLTGKTYQCLSLLANMAGETGTAAKWAKRGIDTFTSIGDKASVLEIQAQKLFCAQEVKDPVKLESSIADLCRLKSYYYSLQVAFRLALYCVDCGRPFPAAINSNYPSSILNSRCPLGRAYRAIMAALEKTDAEYRAKHLKQALRFLHNSKQKLPAILVLRSLAITYESQALYKHAAKFLHEGIRLADELHNHELSDHLTRKLDNIEARQGEVSLLASSIREISEILKNINYNSDVLESLLSFAVSLTGAERGVLLLCEEESEKLRAVAYLHCDDRSARDAEEFSLSIPMQTTADLSFILVENALQDRRTRHLKSIVQHNILSVACIPITIEGQTAGAVYLDHHSVPSLFTEDDFSVFSAIANFISVALQTSDSLRLSKDFSTQLMMGLSDSDSRYAFITKHPPLLEMLSTLPRIAKSDAPVLIMGESGTGKEIMAQLVHHLSDRNDIEMIALNCANFPPNLIEAELFGIEKGVASGVDARDGKFAQADGTSMFLDEIGDMAADVQAKILRALESRQFTKVGGHRIIDLDTRFICATNRNLADMLATGKFREDLYYRISTFRIEIAPLRDRPEDIPLLLGYFLKKQTRSTGRKVKIGPEVMKRLINYSWPGNVRELRNFVEQTVVLLKGEEISLSDLRPEMKSGSLPSKSNRRKVEEAERQLIIDTLKQTHGNQSEAAKSLRLPLSTLRYKMKKYGISPDDFR